MKREAQVCLRSSFRITSKADYKNRVSMSLSTTWLGVKQVVSQTAVEEKKVCFNRDMMHIYAPNELDFMRMVAGWFLPRFRYTDRLIYYEESSSLLVIDIGALSDVQELKRISPDLKAIRKAFKGAIAAKTSGDVTVLAVIILATVKLSTKDKTSKKNEDDFLYKCFSKSFLHPWKPKGHEAFLSHL